MTFYIRPPGGDLHLRDLSSWCLQRMSFLKDVYCCRGNAMQIRDLVDNLTTECECLMEGSKRDATSHFTLRLMCCDDLDMRDYFIQSEIFFFKFRFSCFSAKEILSSLRPLRRHHAALRQSKNLSEQQKEILILLDAITAEYNWRTLVQLYTQDSGLHFIRVPFRFVCEMVAKRTVVLLKGIALVPCCKFSELMAIVFSLVLKEGMRLACSSHVAGDIRMFRLHRAIRAMFQSISSIKNSAHHAISCDDISGLSDSFPLCMSMKLQTLKEKHRLRHHSRIQLTLFLKELGLPLNEALRFWRQEYSQPSSDAGCQHMWRKEERRYTYSIRHLYGMEGARRNYRSHCCESLQNASEEGGGCPFKSPDFCLSNAPSETKEAISNQISEAGYSSACRIHFMHKLKQHPLPSDGEVLIHQPTRDLALEELHNRGHQRSEFIQKPIEYFHCFNSSVNKNVIPC